MSPVTQNWGAMVTFPTDPFSISEPQDQEIVEFYAVQESLVIVFEALKLWKGQSSGCPIQSNP